MTGAAALGALASGCGANTLDASLPSDALGNLDATGIAARIRSGEITAAEALEAAIARSERVNGQLNFIAAPLYEYGRARASETLSGPFAGVPTLIKDLMGVTGQPTRYGSRAFANNVSTEQTPYMDALLAAGLVPFGKSTTPEFGLTATTETLLQGATRNPWNIEHSSGGSSGGAAVAVASRVVPMAHASDGGGSIRIPAACNGLLGLKPSRGRSVVAGSPDPGIQISVNGCVSHSVRDTAAWLAATEATGAGAALPAVGMIAGPNQRRLRILLEVVSSNGDEPTAEVRAAVESAAELCRELGHTVIEGRLAVDGPALADDFILLWSAGAAQVVELVRSQAPANVALDQVLEPLTLGLAAHAQQRGRAAVEAAVGRLIQVEARHTAAFSDIDVHLSPVLTRTPVPLGTVDGATKGFEVLQTLTHYVNTPLWNVAGAPAMSVPLAWSDGGLPIGIQFGAAKGQERLLLELAYELEQARPWASRRPPVNAG